MTNAASDTNPDTNTDTNMDGAIAQGQHLMRRLLAQYAWCVAGLAAVLYLVSQLCGGVCGPSVSYWVSALGLMALLGFSGQVVFKLMRRDANTLWTPAVIFPLSTGLYFGFGSMSALFSTELTRQFLMKGNYAIDGVGLMRTMQMTCLGVAVLVAVMAFTLRLSFGGSSQSGGSQRQSNGFSLATTALLFTLIGAGLKYGLVLPQQYGLIQFTIPGSLKSLSGLTDIGLAVMMYLAARGQKSWALIFFCLWPMHLGLLTLEFSKRVLMFAILLPAAGAFLGHRNWRRLIPWILFAGFVFMTAQNINTAARLAFLERTGSIGASSDFSDRVDMMGEIMSGSVTLDNVASTARSAAQVWWLRLNYSGPQLAAMRLYEEGRPGDWTLSFAEVIVPRFLWPGKPESVAQGRIFNRMVSGNSLARTRVGISIYADGYWQLGWAGTILFSAIAGFILGIVCRINYACLIRRQLIFLPMIFLGMSMAATGPMGFLQKNFIGAMPIYLGYLLLISLMLLFVKSAATQGNAVRQSPTRIPTQAMES